MVNDGETDENGNINTGEEMNNNTQNGTTNENNNNASQLPQPEAEGTSCNEDSSKMVGGLCKGSNIEGKAPRYRIHDFVATFRINNTPIYNALSSQLVLGGLLDSGSRPSAVDVWFRFPTYNRSIWEHST